METIAAVDKALGKLLFIDHNKQICSLQQSNIPKKEEVYLGVDKDINGKPVDTRMLLTREQVAGLLPYLQKFVETGRLL